MFTLPKLAYGYDQLGVHISADIMQLHHSKHHQSYVDKLNAAVASHPELAGTPVDDLLANLPELPASVRQAVRDHGGGHYNHSLFWQWMSPDGGGEPTGALRDQLVGRYGSYQAFVDEFSAKSLQVFGSGWAWLQPNMDIITTANQDSPVMRGLEPPLLGLDVWEHAYYLDYKNKRDDYIKAWWNVVDWSAVQSRMG